MGRLSRFRILILLAWRNLFGHKGKNLLVGLLMAFGTFLVVLGTALLDSVKASMTRSIVSSVAGHLQVYSQDARDDLALFGTSFMESPDVGVIPDFQKVKRALLKVPNVKAVVPMGIDSAEFYTDTTLDQAIERLRQAIRAGEAERVGLVSRQIRALVELMRDEFQNRLKLTSNRGEVEEQLGHIGQVLTDGFWARLPEHPDEIIEFLDTKLAPLVEENEGYFLQYLGTDLPLFAEHFGQFEIVSGEMVPAGARGLLLNQKFYDDYLRNRVAREFDELNREIVELGKRIRKDPLLGARVQRLVRQYRRITLQLEPDTARELQQKLERFLPGAPGSLDQLVQRFLEVDDQTFAERHRFFFSEIAPLVRLYLFKVGEVITIRTYTKSGYIRSTNLKVWGTFRFKGLERSDLAGAYSLMDIVSFRELYGMMTEEKRRELKQIQAAVGLKDVGREEAEEALFGGQQAVETKREGGSAFDEFAQAELKQQKSGGPPAHYDQETVDRGIAVHAAVILEDPGRLAATASAILETSQRLGLGLKVVDWEQASGMVGQVVILIRMILYVAIFIIFLVALVIINNTMIMATMERVTEIGTMRAIGAQSRFVLALFLIETLSLGLAAGAVGALGGAAVVWQLGRSGIPAVANILVLLFSGPRLFPAVGLEHLVSGLLVILVVSVLATFYPAFVATRIQPAVAIQARE